MAITPDLRWRDESGVTHGIAVEVVQVNSPRGNCLDRRWTCRCKLRSFTVRFPPLFIDEKVTCVGCLAAE